MADYSKGAVWEVRKLLWAELQAAGILTASDYRENNVSYIPIIPVPMIGLFTSKPLTASVLEPYPASMPTPKKPIWFVTP